MGVQLGTFVAIMIMVSGFFVMLGENVTAQTAGLSPESQARVTNLAANISNRIDAHVSRLRNITGRLESRIAIVEPSLTPEAVEIIDALLTLSNDKLASAQATMAPIDTVVFEAITSAQPRRNWATVETRYFEANLDLADSRAILIDIVNLLRFYPANQTAEVDGILSKYYTAPVNTTTSTSTTETVEPVATTTAATSTDDIVATSTDTL